ncbi:MAG: tryptophan synthase subunit alpha [Armatimonadetes bacterium]|nr:tryptophan synthase subunit alpha [Armatimonadota bacterium]MBS1711656.1 tryptophan synthase subunit alpha [Armatimonadota bacterium]MBX3109789.1 tryptophan synthase subunit alpha [Fimbriimonadaceae bacterium]
MTLSERFTSLRQRNEAALILFVTAGDPTLEDLPEITSALQGAGADVIEIGIPFTDPIADGPVIQASSQRALDRGVTPGMVLESLGRCTLDIPVVLMGYYNPALSWGLGRFANSAKAAGASATIMCDLIPEEAGDWVAASSEAGLDTVFLAAPTSTPQRRQVVCEAATGFIYAVSRMGVTGSGVEMGESTAGLVADLKSRTSTPVCVGFGISTPDHVRQVSGYADGAIIGSWLVERLTRDWADPVSRNGLLEDVRKLKEATRR